MMAKRVTALRILTTRSKCYLPKINMYAPSAISKYAAIQGHWSRKIVNAGIDSTGQLVLLVTLTA